VDHDIILLGASAGGVDTLTRLCRGLPRDLPAAVLVVQHITPFPRSVLPRLLSRAGPLPAAHAEEGEAIHPGRIYVARPDHHLLVNAADQRLMLRRGPQENRTRPAIDPLFRSAAIAFGPRVVGVVLSGLLDDGTAGLVAIKACGGISVVQNPEDAAWPDMPRNALRGNSPDHCVTLVEMPALLARLARSPAGPACPVPPRIAAEARIAEQEIAAMGEDAGTVGQPSRLSCPQCGGVLNEIEENRREEGHPLPLPDRPCLWGGIPRHRPGRHAGEGAGRRHAHAPRAPAPVPPHGGSSTGAEQHGRRGCGTRWSAGRGRRR